MSEPNGTTAAPSASAGPVAPPERLQMPPTSMQMQRDGEAETNEDFQRKWNSLRGEVKARQSQWDTWRGQTETLATQLREEITELQGQLRTVQSERDGYNTQLEQLPKLTEQASLAAELQAQNDKLSLIMSYPVILGQTTVTETEVDGKKETVRSNPYLDLVMSSSKSGDELRTLLLDLTKRIGQSTTAPPPASPLEMQIPSPTPVAGETIDSLRKQRDDLVLEGRYQEVQALNDRIMELGFQKQ